MRTSQVQKKVLEYLADRPDENAFLRSEFLVCAQSRAGVDKALRALVREGILVRAGYGVLVRGMYNEFANCITPVVSPDEFAPEVLQKLGLKFQVDKATQEYNSANTTQIPTKLAFSVDRRISRKIGFNKRWVNYEVAR